MPARGLSISVDGYGDRVELQLQASIDPLYTDIQNSSTSDWQASVNIDPAGSGFQFWSSSTGGSPLSDAEFKTR